MIILWPDVFSGKQNHNVHVMALFPQTNAVALIPNIHNNVAFVNEYPKGLYLILC